MSLLKKKWIIKDIKYEDFWQNVFDGYIHSKNIEDYWPFVIKNLTVGVQIFIHAIQNNYKIGIVGDFDVDGSCGTAIMIKFLQFYQCDFTYYIPNRFTDGYGLSVKICDMLHEKGVKLLITIDNGTTAYEPIERAKNLGMKVIILDHHSIGDEINADALINPHMNENGFKDLCATGVVFLFLYNANQLLDNKFPIKDYLDLVAIGTICDVMPVININKAFVSLGIDLMNRQLKPVFRMLLINHSKIDSETIGFYLGPFLNAPGRMGDSICTINVLTCEDDKLCDFVMQMIKYNNERKRIENNILQSINIDDDKKNICVIMDVYEGVMGIIAGRLKEKYNKNTCVINVNNGKASMRSVSNMHCGQFIKEGINRSIINFGGGHNAAGGFTLHLNKFDDFKDFFENYKVDDYFPELCVSAVVSLTAMNKKFIEQMNSFGPFGSNKPLFLIPNCIVKSVYVSTNTCFIILFNMVVNISSVIFNISSNPLGEIRHYEGKTVDIVGYPYQEENIIKIRIIDCRLLDK